MITLDCLWLQAKDRLGCTPLHDAATYGHLPVAEMLIAHGSRLLHVDKDRCTALHSACYECNHQIVQLLVQHCDVKRRRQVRHHAPAASVYQHAP